MARARGSGRGAGRRPLAEPGCLLGRAVRTDWVFGPAPGKDRTGVLAALILLMLGVDDELVCWDYEQTELSLTRASPSVSRTLVISAGVPDQRWPWRARALASVRLPLPAPRAQTTTRSWTVSC